MIEIIGLLMLFVGGGLLYDVPFPRFISALVLITIGTHLNGSGVIF